MLKPKPKHARRYWENLSDDQLLDTELITDDPENLADLVYEIPAGDEESYVEFKYDLRGTERERFHCVHGHHAHLAGFVFRKGASRFLVGWMCGKSLYGEDFDQYTADFDAAVNRQDALKRVREIRNAIDPFKAWLEELSGAEAFKLYGRVRGQLREQMPWVYNNLPRAAFMNARIIGAAVPKGLCSDSTDVREEFNRIMNDVSAASLMLVGEPEAVAKRIGLIRSRMDGLVKRLNDLLDLLREVEDFFQPTVLAAICKLANEYDNPKRRKYEAGLLTLTCKRERQKTTITMPKNFVLPSRRGLGAFKSALAGIET
jgi:hypothetical protein